MTDKKVSPANSRQRDGTSADRTAERSRWTLSAISPETRAAVRKAASMEGVTISDWVDTTLRAAARDRLKGGTPALALPPDLLATIDDISRKLDQINREIKRDPERFESFSIDFSKRMESLRDGVNTAVEQLQATTTSVMGAMAEHADAAVTRSRQVADKAVERLIDTSDAALDTVRQFRRGESDDGEKTGSAKENR